MKTLTRKIVIISLLFFCYLPLNSQVLSKKGLIKAVHDADIFYYYDQNYEQAASMYESLLKSYPENSNFKAKLGICYLNINGKKSDALRLLSEASLNIVSNDKEYSEYGVKAPLDTYLYIAVAYHQNDSLKKAISLYSEAKKRLSTTKAFRDEYIDSQISNCRYALEMQKKPSVIFTTLFTSWLSDYPGACNPVLSKNDSVFIFTQKTNGKTHILCSYKSGTWERPSDITKQLGGFDRFYSNSITGNGKLLIIYMDDGADGNLYYSERKDSVWTKIRSIGRSINTIYFQSHGFITPDGKTLYFSSNEPGGEGELDIWYSEKNADGKWSQPVNCGKMINTPYNEDTPYFDQDSDALYFSSVGHASMGGFDVFRSIKKDGTWTEPIGLPYSYNNTLDNKFFILNNGKPGFITSLYDEKNKSSNIYSIIPEVSVAKVTAGRGTIALKDGLAVNPEQTHIFLTDLKKPTSPVRLSLLDTASYNFEVKPGDYQLLVSHTGYKTDTINLNIPPNYSDNYVSVSSLLIPEKVTSGEYLVINNVLFEFDRFDLDEVAKSGLEVLKSILAKYPGLKVEVAGYTDARGGKEYNRKLADKRAQTVIDYLVAGGTSASRFTKKAIGKMDFVAINSNSDGSDNPEGRKYNRRVTFGIVGTGTGVIIRNESYTPEHLRLPLLKTGQKEPALNQTDNGIYTIQLRASQSQLKIDLIFSGLADVKEVRTGDGLFKYYYGKFANIEKARQELSELRKSGYTDAFVRSLNSLLTQ